MIAVSESFGGLPNKELSSGVSQWWARTGSTSYWSRQGWGCPLPLPGVRRGQCRNAGLL